MMRSTRGAALLLAGALALSLAACAPEPGAKKDDVAQQGEGESSWATAAPEDEAAKQTEIPESFPRDAFPIPEDAAVDDTGERSATAWFIVFKASDAAEADRIWDEIVQSGGFAEAGREETADGGRTATLTSASLAVTALTIPNPDDGTVLLSYDIASTTV